MELDRAPGIADLQRRDRTILRRVVYSIESQTAGRGKGLVRYLIAVIISLGCAASAFAQGNYEVQVYGSDLVPQECHHGGAAQQLHRSTARRASWTACFRPTTPNTRHVEITHGCQRVVRDAASIIFTSIQSDGSLYYVGTAHSPAVGRAGELPFAGRLEHLHRDRLAAARSFRRTPGRWEIRPIVDKKIDKLYLAFNPTFDSSFHGPSQNLRLRVLAQLQWSATT